MSVALARARCSRHVIFCLTMCNRKQDLVLFFSRVVIPHFMRRQLLCEKITISGGQVCTFYPLLLLLLYVGLAWLYFWLKLIRLWDLKL